MISKNSAEERCLVIQWNFWICKNLLLTQVADFTNKFMYFFCHFLCVFLELSAGSGSHLYIFFEENLNVEK